MSAATQALSEPKLQNVLFLTDFSPYAEAAAPFARAIAGRCGSTIHAAHFVSPKPIVIGGEFGGSGVELELESEHTARERMNRFLESGAFEGVLYTQTIQIGSVSDAAPKLSAALNVDLIIMGTHGRRGVSHLFLGSVAEQIFRHAQCPVLTIGPTVVNPGLVTGNLKTVLYATNFTAASLKALDYAYQFARIYNTQIRVLHSLRKDALVPGFRAESMEQVRNQLSALVAGAGVPTEVVVDCRPPVDLILSAATEGVAGLIVMGAHGHKFPSAHMSSSVAYRVVCNAPCPVLTVRS